MLRVLSEAFKDVKQVEEDLDRFTVARGECGTSVKNSSLISVRPEDSLHLVALVLLKNNMYSVPVVSYGGSWAGARGPSKKSSSGGDTSDKKNSNNNDNDNNNNNKMGNMNPSAALLSRD